MLYMCAVGGQSCPSSRPNTAAETEHITVPYTRFRPWWKRIREEWGTFQVWNTDARFQRNISLNITSLRRWSSSCRSDISSLSERMVHMRGPPQNYMRDDFNAFRSRWVQSSPRSIEAISNSQWHNTTVPYRTCLYTSVYSTLESTKH